MSNFISELSHTVPSVSKLQSLCKKDLDFFTSKYSYLIGLPLGKSGAESYVTTVSEDNSISFLKLKISMLNGKKFTAVHNDLITVLTSFALEQYKKTPTERINYMRSIPEEFKGFPCYFKLEAITKQLKRNKCRSTEYKNKIKELESLKIEKILRICSADGSIREKIAPSEEIILGLARDSFTKTVNGKTTGATTAVVYFSWKYMQTILEDEEVVYKSNTYLNLKGGSVRRAFQFLIGKESNLNGEKAYNFLADEIISVLDIDNYTQGDKNRTLRKCFTGIQKEEPWREIKLVKDNRTDKYHVFVYLKDKPLLESIADDFVQALFKDFGAKMFNSLEMEEGHVIQWRRELDDILVKNNGETEFLFKKDNLKVSELIIDLTLDTQRRNNNIESVKAYSRKLINGVISGGFIVPDSYKSFVIERVAIAKEALERNKIREEMERSNLELKAKESELIKLFQNFFESTILPNDKIIRELRADVLAKDSSFTEMEEGPLKNSLINISIKELAQREFISGEIGNRIKVSTKHLKELNPSEYKDFFQKSLDSNSADTLSIE